MSIKRIHVNGIGTYEIVVAEGVDVEKELERVLRADPSLDTQTIEWILKARRELRDKPNN
jgi:hypothetical protein